jgi:inner membrane protein
MESNQTKVPHFFSSILVKMILIGGIILVLLIPALLIQDLIQERESLKTEAELDIQDKWGGSQVLTGPFLTVPYYMIVETEGRPVRKTAYLQILPETLSIKGRVEPQIRYRGIYKVVIYQVQLDLDGSFKDVRQSVADAGITGIQWDQARLHMGLSDLRGIDAALQIDWNGAPITADPGSGPGAPVSEGIQVPLDLTRSSGPSRFAMDISLRGSQAIWFTPVGKTTRVSIESEWPHPGFAGAFLPDERRVSESGFHAEWTILHYNRNYPQLWQDQQYDHGYSAFGVDLRLPVDAYQKTMRSVKYAILFLVLTFTLIFFVEILNKSRIHAAQYLMVGASLLTFYVLLLSLSEQIGFLYAYLAAATAIVIQITTFIHMIIRNRQITMITLMILVLLYTYLYVLLQLQDYALLIGSVGLFLILSVIMILSRKIDWYGSFGKDEKVEGR